MPELAKLLGPAIVGALIATGGGVFAFGEKLGNATATAAYWERYAEAVAKMPACR